MGEAEAERIRVAFDLADTGVAVMRQNLRRRHAEATEETIERELQAWLRHRPGALLGDCPGPLRTLVVG